MKRRTFIKAVATHPAGELPLSIEHDIHQQVNTSSKRPTTKSRLNKSAGIIVLFRDFVIEEREKTG